MIVLAVLTTLSILGAMALVLSTRWGIGLSPDSVIYIVSARNLLSGNGLSTSFYPGAFVPMTHYPPLYSALLAGIGIFGMDPVEGARWLNVLLFATNIGFIGFTVYGLTYSFWLSVLSSVIAMVSFPMVQTHSMAWSEPLFTFLGFSGIVLLALYMEKGNALVLTASSMAFALACFTRYPGIAFVSAGVMGIFLLGQSTWRKRSSDALVFSALSSIPLGLWLLRNLALGTTLTGRKLSFHPITQTHLESALDVISAWFLPPTLPRAGRWSSLLIVVALASMGLFFAAQEAIRNKRQDRRRARLPALLGFFIVNYALLLVISISFFDMVTPLDNRILLPVYFAALLLAHIYAPLCLNQFWRTGVIWISLMGIWIAFSLVHLGQSLDWLKHSYINGFGYASRTWKESELLKHVKTLDPRTTIFTNGPDAIYGLTGRPARMIPAKVDAGTGNVNRRYTDDLVQLKAELEKHGGIVVYFNVIRWRWYLPTENELQEKLTLQLLAREKDGSIYQIARHKSR